MKPTLIHRWAPNTFSKSCSCTGLPKISTCLFVIFSKKFFRKDAPPPTHYHVWKFQPDWSSHIGAYLPHTTTLVIPLEPHTGVFGSGQQYINLKNIIYQPWSSFRVTLPCWTQSLYNQMHMYFSELYVLSVLCWTQRRQPNTKETKHSMLLGILHSFENLSYETFPDSITSRKCSPKLSRKFPEIQIQ